MAPDRISRNGGFSLPAKRNSALATAAIASAALLSQTGNAAADEGPSHDEVSRRVTNLYDRAETDSGTYNATRAARTASSTRGRTGPATGGGRRTGGDPALDDIAKQWYGAARAKTGPTIAATLPSDRVAARPAETRRQRPSDAPSAREPKPAEGAMPELTAAPMLALPSAPETAPAALTAAPAQSPSWAPERASQNLTGTGEMPALGSPQLVTGVPEYTPRSVAGVPEYTTQPVTVAPEYTAQPVTGFPEYTPQPAAATSDYPSQPAITAPGFTTRLTAGALEYTAQPATGFPEYAPQVSAGHPEYSPQIGTGLPDHTGQLVTGLPEYTAQTTTGFTDYSGQLGTGTPEYTAQTTTGFPDYGDRLTTGIPEYAAQATPRFPEYTAQNTTGFAEYSAQPTTAHPEYSTPLTAPLATIAPPPADTVQTVPAALQNIPAIPAPRAPEPDWQAPQPAAAPSVDLPTVDPGYDSKVIQVLAFARSQIGKPCVWGAAGPGSYDNSGLTQAAWKVAGVSLPRTTLGQASTGTAVSLYAMQPGDLVFFHDDFSHVGLCTGNGMMIHAPGPGASIREESIYPTGESIIRGAIRPV
ncbi:NlpC/P60 family protein [Streptomyces canus]|uniref:NlpC/P60 family protein n=1 Tax=Streptomyces canus TaxID=58343 RepID=UPI0027860322|nr:cell wall-associated NlpC family hydrolase [Streptomyces canus]MDQ1072649.1 cell wall-associated NlpC family hydrolase [Streptomyces canus]